LATLEAHAAAGPLRGRLLPPGDKSISHRALILGALARGRSSVSGLLDSADVRATRAALAQLGAGFEEQGGCLLVNGLGVEGLRAPDAPLDMGNSGTAMRLLAGVLAAQAFDSTLIGDESLSSRPMRRIMLPLREMGADISGSEEGTAPLRIRGRPLHGITYRSPVASAQVKSCVLLAGLYAQGRTSVTEPALSRDHTERMLPLFGVEMPAPLTVVGGAVLEAADVRVPADISSAAFAMCAALLVPGSDLVLEDVGLNPTRTGLLRALEAMGADLGVDGDFGGFEPRGTVRVRHSGHLRAIELPEEWIPSMVDEIPVLMALAAKADGVTRIRGASELRVKESDRLAVMGDALRRCGVRVADYPDGVDIHGPAQLEDALVDSAGDHRCAMSMAVLALCAPRGIRIRGAGYIATSYPGFVADMNGLGADMRVGGER